MRPPERFETPRLLLRPPVMEDAETIYQAYATDKLVTRFLMWQPHRSIEETEHFLKRCRQVWRDGSAFPWVITLKQNNEMIGMVELSVDGHKAELGYVLAQSYWDQGYASEAASLVVDWTIAQPSIFRVWAVCDVDNHASGRVLEKAGMQLEGTLRRWLMHPNTGQKPRDCYVYSIVK